jgi:predicted nucleic acid-binding protein
VTYLLDTNVVSEWAKPRPDPGVLSWLSAIDEDELYLSVGSLAELRYGIAVLPVGRRRDRLDRWFVEGLSNRFATRILSIDASTSFVWGEVRAERQRAGRPISTMDALIAATARVHELVLVTRNTADFTVSIPNIINPWSTGA